MAVTLTVEELRAALRLGDSAEETAEVTRLLAYATEAVTQHAPRASDTAHNEAARRLGGFLFDQPEAGRGMSYANAMRSSGAARMLLPYRVHRAGYAGAVEAAQEALGSESNPVTGLAVQDDQLVVTFEDGSTDVLDLPAGMGGDGTDQTARDAAGVAQGRADAAFTAASSAQSEADSAALAAVHAQATGNAAQTDITDHEDHHPDGTDQTARDAAATAQGAADAAQTDIDEHEDNHLDGTDQTARDAAGVAQGRADNAFTAAGLAHDQANNAVSAAATAQGAADAAQTDIDEHEAQHPGGGDDAGSPVTLHAFANVGSGWREIDLTQPITTGFLVEFRIADVGAGGGAYALATADVILATTPTSSAPTNYNGALPLKTMQAENVGFGHDTIIVRKSDEENKLWVKIGRGTANSWQIIAYPLYGRGVT